MKYDFTTVTGPRSGSLKWDGMYKKYAEVCGGTAAEAKTALAGIVPLTVADMEFVHPAEFIEGMKDFFGRAVLGYTGPTEGYCEALCGWMAGRHHWQAEASWAVQSPGVVTALYAAALAFTEPGDGIILQTPAYPPFYNAASLQKRRIVENPLVFNDGTYTIDFDHLETLAKDSANKMLIFCSPHNPTGRVWTRGELEKVAGICLRNKVLVVSDEIHSDLILGGREPEAPRHTVFAALGEETAANCVVCTAATKTFNLAGLQCSNIFIPDEKKREKFKAAMGTLSLHEANAATLAACEIAYRRLGPWLDELLTVIESNHRLTAGFCAEKLPAVKAFPIEGTYLQWMDMRGLGVDAKELENTLIRTAKFFSTDGAVFGRAGRGFRRVNLACPRTVLEAALERLAGAV